MFDRGTYYHGFDAAKNYLFTAFDIADFMNGHFIGDLL